MTKNDFIFFLIGTGSFFALLIQVFFKFKLLYLFFLIILCSSIMLFIGFTMAGDIKIFNRKKEKKEAIKENKRDPWKRNQETDPKKVKNEEEVPVENNFSNF